jgi:predicted enzyme related to lactoylglutathione lyase
MSATINFLATPAAPVVKHLHLACTDHARTLEFFAKYFGFRFDHSFSRGPAMPAMVIRNPSGFQIALETDPQNTSLPKWFHVGFLVRTADECRALHDRMVADGVQIIQPITEIGQLVTYLCTDPDGHEVQVYWDAAGAG